MKFKFANCRNIEAYRNMDTGENALALEEGKINILLGLNGVGKTTLVKVIQYSLGGCGDEALLKSLESFDYQAGKPGRKGPTVDPADGPNRRCLVFDSEWIRNNCFKSDTMMEGAYRLYVEEDSLRTLKSGRSKLLAKLHEVLESDGVDDAERAAREVASIAGKTTKKGFAASSKLGAALAGNGPLHGLPDTLADFAEGDLKTRAEWLTWHLDGARFAGEHGSCPYCGEPGDSVKKAMAFDSEHEKDQASAWLKVRELADRKNSVFAEAPVKTMNEALKAGLADDEAYNAAGEFIRNISGVAEAINSLREYANPQGESVTRLSSKELGSLSQKIADGKAAFSKACQEPLDNTICAIEALADKVEQIERIDEKRQRLVDSHAKEYCAQMSAFLESTGYPYRVNVKNGKKGSALVLVHAASGTVITEYDSCLSYGELNALSLALFFTKALKEPDAVVILDDPISSFDGNKRFALLNAMFTTNEPFAGSLAGRTSVIMTHDPLVAHDALRYLKTRNSVSATYLYASGDGEVSSRSVKVSDYRPYTQLVKSKIEECVKDEDGELPFKALVYLRQHFELSRRNTTYDLVRITESETAPGRFTPQQHGDAIAFSLLASLLHCDEPARLKSDGKEDGVEMPQDMITIGEDAINAVLKSLEYRSTFSYAQYSKLLSEKPPSYLVDRYEGEGTSPYDV